MPSLKDIRKRIGTVKSTQKITRAMKLVAAARLRRAQETILASRPYAETLERVIAELAARTDREAHDLLAEREGNRVELVVLTSDRGLAGSFNSQITRFVGEMYAGELADCEVSLRVVGKKGNEYFKRRAVEIESYDPAPTPANALEFSQEMSGRLVDDFTNQKFDRVYLVYNRFRSAIAQDVVAQQILPVIPAEHEGEDMPADFLYEPSRAAVLDHLLPLHVQIQLYRSGLESIASELGSRMSAMDGATRNAGEMIEKLSLQYNRARQAAITKELLEITSGAEALKG
jgi:F-type H+-transporting ATPase subunit gamma